MIRRTLAALAVLMLIATTAYSSTQTITIQPGNTVVIVSPEASSGGTPPSGGNPGGGNPGGGAGSGDSGWNGVCPGFPNTRAITMNWAVPTRLYTSSYGGFGEDDAVVVQFTTGNVSNPAGFLSRISAAEYNSSPSSRIATLSETPCDFGPQSTWGAAGEGNSVTMVFALGTGNGYGYYPVLKLNTTYYLNMKNSPNSTCRGNHACDMFVDLSKFGGV